MRKEYIYILILILSIGIVGWEIVALINTRYQPDENIQKSSSIENIYENKQTVTTASENKKVSPNMKFALKKCYDECNHFEYEEAQLPVELVNLTQAEVEDYYKDWEVAEFTDKQLTLTKEINGYCDQHFLIKLDQDHVNVYQFGRLGELNPYQKTDIARDYLPQEDIENLEEGITVYGQGKLSAVLEDYE